MARVHIINPLWDATGGSEWHAVSLFELLAESADVTLWTEDTPDPAFLGRYPIRRIGPNSFPEGGNLVFLGVYGKVGGWIRAARPKRVVVVYNFFQPDRLLAFLNGLRGVPALPEVEVSFVSDYLRRNTPSVPGTVHISPVDIGAFSVAERPERPLTIGRVSRDVPEKHHPEDLALYRKLASVGIRVRVLGGTCLADGGLFDGIELLPAGSEPVPHFLGSIDAFLYRTHPAFQEAWGRVVIEAMASGLPILASRNGGFVEAIVDGENGLLIGSTSEAEQRLLELRDPETRRKLGAGARATVERIYSQEALNEIADFYSR